MVSIVNALGVSEINAQKIEWKQITELKDIQAKSGSDEKRPILIYTWATWCVYCKAMERSVFTDIEVIEKISNNVIPVKVDLESDVSFQYQKEWWSVKEFVRSFGIETPPSLLILNSSGSEVIRKVNGALTKQQFIDLLMLAGEHRAN